MASPPLLPFPFCLALWLVTAAAPPHSGILVHLGKNCTSLTWGNIFALFKPIHTFWRRLDNFLLSSLYIFSNNFLLSELSLQSGGVAWRVVPCGRLEWVCEGDGAWSDHVLTCHSRVHLSSYILCTRKVTLHSNGLAQRKTSFIRFGC